jgi:hypothetical protein
MRTKCIHIFAWLPLALLFGSVQIVQAEPAPDKLVVNHETKECAIIFGGDECMDCLPPEGWEVLGWSYQSECPAGYTLTEVEEICTPFKTEFCCTEGHSGAHGDCDDLVINTTTSECTFVEDVNACHLPADWEATPGEVYWACPGNYDWIDDFECLAEPATDSNAGSEWLPFRCGGSALSGLLFFAVMIIITKRRTK